MYYRKKKLIPQKNKQQKKLAILDGSNGHIGERADAARQVVGGRDGRPPNGPGHYGGGVSVHYSHARGVAG